jgi:hypothetical protein
MFETCRCGGRRSAPSWRRRAGSTTGRASPPSVRSMELVCAATATEAALAAELAQSQRAEQASLGVPAAQQGRGVAAQVALARRESHHRGQRHLGLANVVVAELPHTWSAWRAGRITEWRATLIARETACLSRDNRAAVDAAVAGDPHRLEMMGDRELARACQQEAYRLDPESYVSRRRQAEADRHVSLRPAPDAMTWLSALLPVKDGVAVKVALDRAADRARAAGDARSRSQLEADTLVDSVLAGSVERVPGAVDLGLVMTDTALFGTSDEPAHVDGFGPVPAELAREILAGACSRDERVWLRRLYADPTSGELVAMDSQARLFRSSLRRFVTLRDRFCRTPWCDAPIRHRDHAWASSEGRHDQGRQRPGSVRGVQPRQAGTWVASPTLARRRTAHRPDHHADGTHLPVPGATRPDDPGLPGAARLRAGRVMVRRDPDPRVSLDSPNRR